MDLASASTAVASTSSSADQYPHGFRGPNQVVKPADVLPAVDDYWMPDFGAPYWYLLIHGVEPLGWTKEYQNVVNKMCEMEKGVRSKYLKAKSNKKGDIEREKSGGQECRGSKLPLHISAIRGWLDLRKTKTEDFFVGSISVPFDITMHETLQMEHGDEYWEAVKKLRVRFANAGRKFSGAYFCYEVRDIKEWYKKGPRPLSCGEVIVFETPTEANKHLTKCVTNSFPKRIMYIRKEEEDQEKVAEAPVTEGEGTREADTSGSSTTDMEEVEPVPVKKVKEAVEGIRAGTWRSEGLQGGQRDQQTEAGPSTLKVCYWPEACKHCAKGIGSSEGKRECHRNKVNCVVGSGGGRSGCSRGRKEGRYIWDIDDRSG